jgi:hypothetical protein
MPNVRLRALYDPLSLSSVFSQRSLFRHAQRTKTDNTAIIVREYLWLSAGFVFGCFRDDRALAGEHSIANTTDARQLAQWRFSGIVRINFTSGIGRALPQRP